MSNTELFWRDKIYKYCFCCLDLLVCFFFDCCAYQRGERFDILLFYGWMRSTVEIADLVAMSPRCVDLTGLHVAV